MEKRQGGLTPADKSRQVDREREKKCESPCFVLLWFNLSGKIQV